MMLAHCFTCRLPAIFFLLVSVSVHIHQVGALIAPSADALFNQQRLVLSSSSSVVSSPPGCLQRRKEVIAMSAVGGCSKEFSSRRLFVSSMGVLSAAATAARASAAPPIAVISEQLGYFPVTSSTGETLYVPSRARRSSSEQSVELAQYLKQSGAVMYGAFWCPHCRNQKEMFGKEAWSLVKYVECAPQGYGANSAICLKNGIDGYPEWRFGNGKKGSGEMTLDRIATLSGYKGKFNADLEEPMPLSSGSCR